MYNSSLLKQVFRDRGFLIAWIVTCVLCLAILLLSVIEIRPSDLQVPIRYTAFGVTNIYRAQWYVEFVFPLFALMVMTLHTLLAIRLYSLKHRDISRSFMWLTAIILGIALCMFLAIFRVISIVE